MATFDTTDAETVRVALAALIESISPRYEPRRTEAWTWQKDQEIAGTMRNFDLIFEAEVEIPDGAHGGGLEYASDVEIRVSYPVAEPDRPRFIGADGQDLAAILIRAHTSITGMFPVSLRGELPIFDRSWTGQSGGYVASYFTRVHFFVDDTVAVVS